MGIKFQDRVSTYPNRYKVNKQDGTSELVTLERADEPITEGTPLNADTFNAIQRIHVPWNLLDNSDFTNPVNQRGGATYVANGYTIDRWRLWTSGATLSVGSSSITARAPLYQLVENYKANTIYTLAVKYENGDLIVKSHTPANGSSDGTDTEFYLVSGDARMRVRIASGTIVWAALYKGEYTAETLPEYQPKGYAAELAECQRYYVRFASYEDMIAFSGGSNNQYGYFPIPIPVPMRSEVVPTVNYEKIDIYGLTTGSAVEVTGITSYFTDDNNALLIRAKHEKNAFESQTPIMLRIKAYGYIELVADL